MSNKITYKENLSFFFKSIYFLCFVHVNQCEDAVKTNCWNKKNKFTKCSCLILSNENSSLVETGWVSILAWGIRMSSRKLARSGVSQRNRSAISQLISLLCDKRLYLESLPVKNTMPCYFIPFRLNMFIHWSKRKGKALRNKTVVVYWVSWMNSENSYDGQLGQKYC